MLRGILNKLREIWYGFYSEDDLDDIIDKVEKEVLELEIIKAGKLQTLRGELTKMYLEEEVMTDDEIADQVEEDIRELLLEIDGKGGG